jgi:GNAT superfamily N-acetyltransferase
MSTESKKRKPSDENVHGKAKKIKGGIEIKHTHSSNAIWQVVDYLQKQVQQNGFGSSFWHNLDVVMKYAKDDTKMFICAYDHGNVVGYLCGPGKYECGGGIAIVDVFFMYRRMGIGRALVKEAEKCIANGHGSDHIYGGYNWPVCTVHAVASSVGFWTALGYTSMGDRVSRVMTKTIPCRVSICDGYSIPGVAHVGTILYKFTGGKYEDYGEIEEREYQIFTGQGNPYNLWITPDPANMNGQLTTNVKLIEFKPDEFVVTVLNQGYAEHGFCNAMIDAGLIVQTNSVTLDGSFGPEEEGPDVDKFTFKICKLSPSVTAKLQQQLIDLKRELQLDGSVIDNAGV